MLLMKEMSLARVLLLKWAANKNCCRTGLGWGEAADKQGRFNSEEKLKQPYVVCTSH